MPLAMKKKRGEWDMSKCCHHQFIFKGRNNLYNVLINEFTWFRSRSFLENKTEWNSGVTISGISRQNSNPNIYHCIFWMAYISKCINSSTLFKVSWVWTGWLNTILRYEYNKLTHKKSKLLMKSCRFKQYDSIEERKKTQKECVGYTFTISNNTRSRCIHYKN